MKNFKELVSSLLLALGFCLFVGVNAQQRCVPDVVPDVRYKNYTLYWSPLNSASCDIISYVIYVYDLEEGTQFHYEVSYDLEVNSFNLTDLLEMCKNYTFEVHALTIENVLGPSHQLVATTEPSGDLNLTLSEILTSVQENRIDIKWNLTENREKHCISYYRVVHWDENNQPQDDYVQSTNYTLRGEVPCMNYTFQVNAIIMNPDIQGPLSEVVATGYPKAPKQPKLVNLVPSSRSVNMTWEVESSFENRCKLWGLTADIIGVGTTYVPIKDTSLRPNVNFSINNLLPNNVYVGHIFLTNYVDTSKYVTITFQTSDEE